MADEPDPRGVIAAAYGAEGIGPAECRSIFLDWAMAHDGPHEGAIQALLTRHGEADHPMTAVLREGLEPAPPPRRRGGRRRP